jgi:hypothetical protein
MTDEDARLLRLALVSLEETMNEVISGYFEKRSLTDGDEGIHSAGRPKSCRTDTISLSVAKETRCWRLGSTSRRSVEPLPSSNAANVDNAPIALPDTYLKARVSAPPSVDEEATAAVHAATTAHLASRASALDSPLLDQHSDAFIWRTGALPRSITIPWRDRKMLARFQLVCVNSFAAGTQAVYSQ